MLEILQAELQLVGIELLGATTELAALQPLDQLAKTLDLGISAGQGFGELAYHLLQERRVRWQFRQVDLHAEE